MIKKVLFVAILLLACVNTIFAQNAKASISIISEETENHAVGDTLYVKILVNISPEICVDGMEKTKTYLSGLDIINSSKWNQMSVRQWEKQMQVLTRKNKKGISKITVFRKADKGDFFVQKKISVVE